MRSIYEWTTYMMEFRSQNRNATVYELAWDQEIHDCHLQTVEVRRH
jgi:hypothetical protein